VDCQSTPDIPIILVATPFYSIRLLIFSIATIFIPHHNNFIGEYTTDKNLPMKLVAAIESSFQRQYEVMIASDDGGVSAHQIVLATYNHIWKQLRSNKTCLSCLARQPEDTLEFNHSLCSVCIRTHGVSTLSDPWLYTISKCPLCCQDNRVAFPQKPDTAGIRALIIEGGGIRGMIPLTFLKEVELAVGLPMGIQEHFDIAFGISSDRLMSCPPKLCLH